MIDDNFTKSIYLKSTTVYVPSSELGLSHLLSRLQGEGLGESQFRRLEKSLALCLPYSVDNLNGHQEWFAAKEQYKG
jgi:hypothetical protein